VKDLKKKKEWSESGEHNKEDDLSVKRGIETCCLGPVVHSLSVVVEHVGESQKVFEHHHCLVKLLVNSHKPKLQWRRKEEEKKKKK